MLIAFAHDTLHVEFDPTAERRALGDKAVNQALHLQPHLPEVHLAYANHLYRSYRDYERARSELAIARRGLPNNAELIYLEALMYRRQDEFDAAEQSLNATIQLDPKNPQPVFDLGETLSYTRQFSAAEGMWNRLIDLRPDQPIVKAQKEACNTIQRTADDATCRSILGSLPTSLAADRLVLSGRLNVAIDHRDWLQQKRCSKK
jgi:Flp pilus assembly protein TadD